MKRRALLCLLVSLLGLAAAGWVYLRMPAHAAPLVWQTELGGGKTIVSVHRVSGTAESAAAEREQAYRDAGWETTPVSTPTFKLLLRGHDMTAILAEDMPEGTTVTELLRHNVL